MSKDKCISSENIFADLNFSIDMFNISKIISSTTRVLFQAITCRLLYQNYFLENYTNELNKKIILKAQQKIDNSNSCCINKYNVFNKIQKVVYTIFAFNVNTTKRKLFYEENCNYRIKLNQLTCQK